MYVGRQKQWRWLQYRCPEASVYWGTVYVPNSDAGGDEINPQCHYYKFVRPSYIVLSSARVAQNSLKRRSDHETFTGESSNFMLRLHQNPSKSLIYTRRCFLHKGETQYDKCTISDEGKAAPLHNISEVCLHCSLGYS